MVTVGPIRIVTVFFALFSEMLMQPPLWGWEVRVQGKHAVKDKDSGAVSLQTSKGKCVSIYRDQEKEEFGAVKSSVSPDFVTYWFYDSSFWVSWFELEMVQPSGWHLFRRPGMMKGKHLYWTSQHRTKTSEGTKNKWFLQKATNELMVAAGKGWGEGQLGIGIDMHTLLYLRWIPNKDLLRSTGNSVKIMWQPGWDGVGGEWIHV